MKKVAFVIILIVLSAQGVSFAQAPEESQLVSSDCGCKVYPYKFCKGPDGKTKDFICTDDPHRKPPPQGTLAPNVRDNPMVCLVVDFDDYYNAVFTYWEDNEGKYAVTGEFFRQIADRNTLYSGSKAEDMWNGFVTSSCPQSANSWANTPKECCFEVRPTWDPGAFHYWGITDLKEGVLGLAISSWNYYDCKQNCGGRSIMINCTQEFFFDGAVPDPSTNTTLIRAYGDANQFDNPDARWYDLPSILLHEIGHMMGFDDLYKAPSECNNFNSWMSGTLPAKSRQYPTLEDQCYFAKLYCPNEVPPCGTNSIKFSNQENNFWLSTYPNPTSNNTSIILEVPKTDRYDLVLFNQLGQVVISIFSSTLLHSGKMEMPVDLTLLPTGSYTIILSSNGKSISKKILRLN